MRRWLRRGLWVLGGLVLLVVLVVAGAVLYLQTEAGGNRVGRFIVSKANESLSGTLAVDSLDFRGDTLVFTDVVLRDPSGQVVAEVERVIIDLGPTALFTRTAKVDAVRLVRPELYVVQDAEGTNLQRALAPKDPKPEQPDEGGQLPVNIVIDDFAIEDGLVVYENAVDPDAPTVAVDELSAEGALALYRKNERLVASLQANAEMAQPISGPIALQAQVDGLGERKAVEVELSAAGAKLVANAEVLDADAEHARIDVRMLELPPEVARAFVPQWPLAVPPQGTARGERSGPFATAAAELSAGSAKLLAQGQVNIATLRVDGLEVVGQDIDLSQLVPDAPPSDLSFELQAEGGGTSIETARGELRFEMPKSKLGDGTVGPVRLDVDARGGVVTVNELLARLPGLAVVAEGTLTEERVEFVGRAAAKDLADLAELVGPLMGRPDLQLGGRGALAFRVEGPLRSPAVMASGRFPYLRYEENRAQGLRVQLLVPSLREPLKDDAKVAVRARSLTLADRHWVRPHLEMRIEDRAFTLDAGTRGFATLDVDARGTIDADREGLTLSSLSLRYPEARWRLQGDAHLGYAGGELQVEDLVLRSGRQRVALDATLSDGNIDAALDVDRLALSKLPKAFVDPSLRLGGTVSAEIAATGSLQDPDVDADVALQDVRFKEYEDLNLEVDATWKNGRAKGSLSADALGVRAHGTFSVPVEALQAGTSAPISADVKLERVALSRLLEELEQDLPISGVMQGRLQVSGTARTPRVDASVEVADFQYPALPQMDLALDVDTDRAGRLDVRLTADTHGEPSTVALETPWTVGELIRSPPTAQQALKAPMTLALHMRDFPVPVPLAQKGVRPVARGTASVPQGTGGAGEQDVAGYALLRGDVVVKGTPLRPRGGGELTLTKLRLGDLPGIAAALKLSLAPAKNEVGLTVVQDEREVLRAQATVNGALSRALRPLGWTRLPFSVEADFGPISIMEVQQWIPRPDRPTEEDEIPLITGVASGQLRASGTLGAPEVSFDVAAHSLGAAQSAALGDVSVRYRYDDAVSVLEANLISGATGIIEATAKVPLELSWRTLQRGLRWRRAPVDARMRAEGFDPSFLAGLIPKVLDVDGRIDARMNVDGPLGLPRIRGRLEWSDGELALLGSGEYRDIHLLVRGSEQQAVIEELFARAGKGSAKLQATIDRVGDAAKFKATATLDEFPLVAEDQLVATVSLDSRATGTASVERIDVPELFIDEATVVLPPNARRDIQKLEPPENVTFVWNGEPIESEEEVEAPPKEQAAGGAGEAGGDVREIAIAVTAPRNLWVKGDDLNVEVGLGDGFRVVVREQTQLFGRVNILRGHIAVLGKRFEFGEDSRVVFTGPMLEPRVNLAAIHEISREDIVITLNVTGQGDDIEMRPTSDPPLTETEIYTLIATGRRSLRRGSSGTSVGNPAASLLGSLAASQLKGVLERTLPLDVINIQAGERGIAGTRVEAGLYITDRLYLGIESEIAADRTDDENQNQLNIEYQLWKNWMLELEYGDAREGNADLIWRKRY